MANSIDPDQTAPSGGVWSGSALLAYAILFETLMYKISGIYCKYNQVRIIRIDFFELE